MGIAFLVGRAYALTVLWSILHRPTVENGTSSNTKTSPGRAGILTGVQVHHSATVVIGDGSDDSYAHQIELGRYARSGVGAGTEKAVRMDMPVHINAYNAPFDEKHNHNAV